MPGRMVREDFGDEKHLVASPGNRLGDQFLCGAVHLGRVNMGHARIEAAAQRGDRRCAAAALDVPGPLTDDRNFALRGTKLTAFHGVSSFLNGFRWKVLTCNAQASPPTLR